ncbi:monooxygenase hypC [Apiospora phragmitis]|uniref:Monooxygenase hypC n=1 Tax=Apiospora phragmitis TaxID=2905665 RepID=A0ABR1TSH7_9PEZI
MSSSANTSTVRALQATNAAVLTTTAGLNLGLSFFVIPRLLESPTPLMLRQWGRMFAVTSPLLPPAMMVPGLVHAALAYYTVATTRGPQKGAVGNAVAALLALSVMPWTLGLMVPINEKLLRKVDEVQSLGAGAEKEVEAREVGAREEETAHALVDRWALLNLYRGSAVLVSGCLGLYAAVF